MADRQASRAEATATAENPRGGRRGAIQRRLQTELRQHYRQITTQLLLMERPAIPWLIGITSAIRGEGKTMLAYGLATALASDLAERVVLVELDFERPIMANEMNVAATPGLAEVIQAGAPLLNAARSTHLPNLAVVPAGQVRGEMAQLVNLPEWRQVWPLLGQIGTIVVCDLPAVLVNPSTALLARQMSTLVLTVRAGATPTNLVDQAIEQLDRSRIAGVILNNEEHRLPRWLQRLFGEYQ